MLHSLDLSAISHYDTTASKMIKNLFRSTSYLTKKNYMLVNNGFKIDG